MDPDPDPRKEIEVDPDPERGLKWFRIWIRPNAVDPDPDSDPKRCCQSDGWTKLSDELALRQKLQMFVSFWSISGALLSYEMSSIDEILRDRFFPLVKFLGLDWLIITFRGI